MNFISAYRLTVNIGAHDQNDLPEAVDLAGGIEEGLPKEWFTQETEGDRYEILSIRPGEGEDTSCGHPVDWKATAKDRETVIQASIKRNVALAAELEQERRLTTRLEEQNEELQSKYDSSLKDWVAIRDDRDKWQRFAEMRMATIKSDSEAITSLQRDIIELKDQRKGADKSLSFKQNEINRLELSLTDAHQEAQNHAMMVAKIVGAMTAAGYDISGWGDDDQLANLEGSLDDIRSAAAELGDTLSEVRTER